ncbi:hypothetical protein AMTRI_Chr09g41710 [Amborella trichopoda]
MDHFLVAFLMAVVSFLGGAAGSTFTIINNCDYTVWPGILSNAGSAKLSTTGFELQKGQFQTLQPPAGWSGRFWGRTGCTFDSSGRGSCATGDCGSNQIECNGAGAAPPATLAEFTLGVETQDFYDVSLVDGYNLPMIVEGNSGGSACAATGCLADLNERCPAELRVASEEGNVACKSACEAFRRPEFCCSGMFATPDTCKPSYYSELFKTACPRSYSYAYDDATSTFTCTGGDYTITFCPTTSSQKASKDPSPQSTETDTGTVTVTGGGEAGVMLGDESWIESMSTSGAPAPTTLFWGYPAFLHTFSIIVSLSIFLQLL